MIKKDTTVAEAKMSFQSRTLRSISVSRLFYIDDVVQNGRSVPSLGCHEKFPCLFRECKIYWCGLALSSKLPTWEFSRRHLEDFVDGMHLNARRTCCTIIFPISANHINDFWRCSCHCRRRFQNSLVAQIMKLLGRKSKVTTFNF